MFSWVGVREFEDVFMFSSLQQLTTVPCPGFILLEAPGHLP